jgi:hypothetical protein
LPSLKKQKDRHGVVTGDPHVVLALIDADGDPNAYPRKPWRLARRQGTAGILVLDVAVESQVMVNVRAHDLLNAHQRAFGYQFLSGRLSRSLSPMCDAPQQFHIDTPCVSWYNENEVSMEVATNRVVRE